MYAEPGHLYHLYNQGNNQETLFRDEKDYYQFLRLTRSHLQPVCEIIAWCLMPNHFHFCIQADERSIAERLSGKFQIQAFSHGVGRMLSGYSALVNAKYSTTGGRFRPKSKLKLLTSEGNVCHKEAIIYLHNNPVRAGLCESPEDWIYSSARDYTGLRRGTLCNLSRARDLGFL